MRSFDRLAVARRSTSVTAHEQYWNAREVSHCVRDAAVDHVLDEPMAVSRHGDEIAAFAIGRLRDLARRIAASQKALHVDARRLERCTRLLEILAVDTHLLRLAEIELLDVSRRETVG